jgi:hypothetical protein
MGKIIKQVNVTATFPGGRVVSGWMRFMPDHVDQSFQIWQSENISGTESTSFIVNPTKAETIQLNVEYETREFEAFGR